LPAPGWLRCLCCFWESGRDVPRLAKRPEHEHQRGKQSVETRQNERKGLHLKGKAYGQGAGAHRRHAQRKQRAQPQPQHRARTCEHQNLGQINAKNRTAAGPKAFERGDDRALACKIGRDGVGHANAADHQCGDADKGEKLRQVSRGPAHIGRRVAGIVDCKTGVGKTLFYPLAQSLEPLSARAFCVAQRNPVVPADERAWLHKPGCFKVIQRHQYARPEHRPAAQPVRLARQLGHDLHLGAA